MDVCGSGNFEFELCGCGSVVVKAPPTITTSIYPCGMRETIIDKPNKCLTCHQGGHETIHIQYTKMDGSTYTDEIKIDTSVLNEKDIKTLLDFDIVPQLWAEQRKTGH